MTNEEVKKLVLADPTFNSLYTWLQKENYFKDHELNYNFAKGLVNLFQSKDILIDSLIRLVSLPSLTSGLGTDKLRTINQFLLALAIIAQIWDSVKTGAFNDPTLSNENYYLSSYNDKIKIYAGNKFSDLQGYGMGIEIMLYTSSKGHNYCITVRFIVLPESIKDENYLKNIILQIWNTTKGNGDHYSVLVDTIDKKLITGYLNKVL